MAVEGLIQPVDAVGEFFAPRQKVHAQHTVCCQARFAVQVKRQRVEPSRAGFVIEAIDQDQVIFLLGLDDEIRAIGVMHPDALRILRQLEKLPRDGFDLRFDFHHGELGLGPVAPEELGERCRAQANQQHAARPIVGAQEQGHHHFFGVVKLQRKRPRDAHRALHPVGAEMQVTHAGRFAGIDVHAGLRARSELDLGAEFHHAVGGYFEISRCRVGITEHPYEQNLPP